MNFLQNNEFLIFATNFFGGLQNKYELNFFLKNSCRAHKILIDKKIKSGCILSQKFENCEMATVKTDKFNNAICYFIKKKFNCLFIGNFGIAEIQYLLILNELEQYINYESDKKKIYIFFCLNICEFDNIYNNMMNPKASSGLLSENFHIVFDVVSLNKCSCDKKEFKNMKKLFMKIFSNRNIAINIDKFERNQIEDIIFVEGEFLNHKYSFFRFLANSSYFKEIFSSYFGFEMQINCFRIDLTNLVSNIEILFFFADYSNQIENTTIPFEIKIQRKVYVSIINCNIFVLQMSYTINFIKNQNSGSLNYFQELDQNSIDIEKLYIFKNFIKYLKYSGSTYILNNLMTYTSWISLDKSLNDFLFYNSYQLKKIDVTLDSNYEDFITLIIDQYTSKIKNFIIEDVFTYQIEYDDFRDFDFDVDYNKILDTITKLQVYSTINSIKNKKNRFIYKLKHLNDNEKIVFVLIFPDNEMRYKDFFFNFDLDIIINSYYDKVASTLENNIYTNFFLKDPLTLIFKNLGKKEIFFICENLTEDLNSIVYLIFNVYLNFIVQNTKKFVDINLISLKNKINQYKFESLNFSNNEKLRKFYQKFYFEIQNQHKNIFNYYEVFIGLVLTILNQIKYDFDALSKNKKFERQYFMISEPIFDVKNYTVYLKL